MMSRWRPSDPYSPRPIILANAGSASQQLCDERRQYYLDLNKHLADNTHPKPTRPDAYHGIYAHNEVKQALGLMFGSKCAYCEADVTMVSWQHVEHFRPVARYPALAYARNNLLLACGRCNGKPNKSDNFPIAPSGKTREENRPEPCSQLGIGELPMLIDPSSEDPEPHFNFRDGRIIARTTKGKHSRDVYGLNRDQLVRGRKQWLAAIRPIAEEYRIGQMENDPVRQIRHRAVLFESVQSSAPFAGMVRSELKSMGIDWRTL